MRVSPGLVLVAVLAGAGCRTSTGKAVATPEPRPAGELVGRVERVDPDTGSLLLRVGDEAREVLVAADAEVRIDDFKGTFEDIREGQRVRAALDAASGQAEGVRIQILDRGATQP